MEKEIQKISVRIGGMSYNLVSGESEAYTRQIAARADEMIRRISMSSPHLSQQMTTILALVNAADELTRQAAQQAQAEQQREAAERKVTELRAELAKSRELNWEMKKEILHLSAQVKELERQPAERVRTTAAAPASSPAPAPAPAPASQSASPIAEPVRPAAAERVPPPAAKPVAAPVTEPAASSVVGSPVTEPAASPVIGTPAPKPGASPVAKPTVPTIPEVSETPLAPAGAHPGKATVSSNPLFPASSSRSMKSAAVSTPVRTSDSPLKSWIPNTWADPGESRTADAADSDDGDDHSGETAGSPVVHPETAEAPRPIDPSRQTGIEDYLLRNPAARSTVEDLSPDDEP